MARRTESIGGSLLTAQAEKPDTRRSSAQISPKQARMRRLTGAHVQYRVNCRDSRRAIMLLERIQKCRYCSREMAVSWDSYSANPFCDHCYDERLSAGDENRLPVIAVLQGAYVRFIPSPGTPGADGRMLASE